MLSSGSLYTPAERDPHEAVAAQQRALQEIPLLARLLDAMPEPAVVINGRQQIVAWNSRVETVVPNSSGLLGQRVDDVLATLNAGELPDAFGLQVRTMPLDVGGALYSVLALRETSGADRRAREHFFFHDVLNTAGALMGLLDLFAEEPHHVDPALLTQAARLAHALVDEIERESRRDRR